MNKKILCEFAMDVVSVRLNFYWQTGPTMLCSVKSGSYHFVVLLVIKNTAKNNL